MNPESLRTGVLLFVTLIASLSVHEAAHAAVANALGDPTARNQGRLSLNPMVHLDQLGTIMIALMAFYGMGIGWAKPVPVNPTHFRNPHRDMGLVAFAGPLSNMFQAVLSAWVLHLLPQSPGAHWDLLFDLFHAMVVVNVSLAAFNLLPVYPLDGQKVVSALLPRVLARPFDFHCVRLGAWPLLIVILWEWILPIPGPISLLLGPVRHFLLQIVQFSSLWLG